MSEEDRIVNELLERNGRIRLARKVYKLENIIKEVREILNQDKASASFNTAERMALEILDKGE